MSDSSPNPPGWLATILPAVNALIATLVWPLFAVWTIGFLAHHHRALVCDVERLSPYIKTSEFHVGPVSLAVETQGIANALAGAPQTQRAETPGASSPEASSFAPVPLDYAQVLAAGAVSNLETSGVAAASRALRVLWVDPHPGNNINLQVAFQKLGFIVVTVQDDTAVPHAFELAQFFNVVVTNMARNGSDEGGLKTATLVQGIQPGIPVIVYSARWAATHGAEEAKYGVKLISNKTDQVFQTVVSIAQAMDKSRQALDQPSVASCQ